MKHMLIALIATIALAAPAQAKWVNAGSSVSLAAAETKCNSVAKAQRRGFWDIDMKTVLVGGLMGNALMNKVQNDRVKHSCMASMGWKWSGAGKTASRKN
jgi:hypothetical protein